MIQVGSPTDKIQTKGFDVKRIFYTVWLMRVHSFAGAVIVPLCLVSHSYLVLKAHTSQILSTAMPLSRFPTNISGIALSARSASKELNMNTSNTNATPNDHHINIRNTMTSPSSNRFSCPRTARTRCSTKRRGTPETAFMMQAVRNFDHGCRESAQINHRPSMRLVVSQSMVKSAGLSISGNKSDI